MTRILIADEYDVVRSGLRTILETQPDWEVVAEAADGKEAILRAMEARPDVAVLDHSLPLINGLEVTRHIRVRLPTTEVLIFTVHDDRPRIEELLKAGARGFLLKSDAKHSLVGAVASLAIHKPFLTTKVLETLLGSFLRRRSRAESTLTNRERGVAQLVAEGRKNREIASILDISLKTVETHRAAIMRKLNLSSSAALVRYAVRNKLVES